MKKLLKCYAKSILFYCLDKMQTEDNILPLPMHCLQNTASPTQYLNNKENVP